MFYFSTLPTRSIKIFSTNYFTTSAKIKFVTISNNGDNDEYDWIDCIFRINTNKFSAESYCDYLRVNQKSFSFHRKSFLLFELRTTGTALYPWSLFDVYNSRIIFLRIISSLSNSLINSQSFPISRLLPLKRATICTASGSIKIASAISDAAWFFVNLSQIVIR